MKLRGVIFSLALAFAVVLPPLAQASQAGQLAEPKLVIESFTHDFGEVKAGAPLTYSFIVKNQGKADLLIKSVAPG